MFRFYMRVVLVLLLPVLVAEEVGSEVRRAWRNMRVMNRIAKQWGQWCYYWANPTRK